MTSLLPATSTKDTINWPQDLPTLLALGFELGYTGETAWGTARDGMLWTVTYYPKEKGKPTVWYKWEKSLDGPSTRVEHLTWEEFEEMFYCDGGSDGSEILLER